jgi:hypothetical protein
MLSFFKITISAVLTILVLLFTTEMEVQAFKFIKSKRSKQDLVVGITPLYNTILVFVLNIQTI